SWHSSALQLVPDSQLQQRAIVNATAAPVPAALLHTLFTDQVAQRPQQPAVITPTRTLNYETLYAYAMQLGTELRSLRARQNRLVAVIMEKGWEQVVGVLGVLYSGAAYLPIDPELPHERLCYLLENAEVELVVTTQT